MSERALLDTNVLVYGFDPDADRYSECRSLLEKIQDAGSGLCIAP